MFALARLRTCARVLWPKLRNHNVNSIRKSSGEGWTYRDPVIKPSREVYIKTELIMGLMWYWVLWHLWYEGEHITGHYDYPDPSKWTDAELGIPPDNED